MSCPSPSGDAGAGTTHRRTCGFSLPPDWPTRVLQRVLIEHLCYMAAGQSPLSCWTQAAGAQEPLWPGRSALAARHSNLGQESQANGPILLIQPRGRHTAALSFTARRGDKSEGGGEQSGGIWTGPASKSTFLYPRDGVLLDIQLHLRPCLDWGNYSESHPPGRPNQDGDAFRLL